MLFSSTRINGGGAGGSGTGTVTSISGTNSIVSSPNPITSTGTFALVNDTATPGNSKYYGTDGSGTRGFFTLPSGSGLTLETNGFTNGSQTLLNLTGSNATTVTDNGTGTITIDTPYPAPAGLNTMVQFNGSGVFTASPYFIYDSSNSVFEVGWTAGRNIALNAVSGKYDFGDVDGAGNGTFIHVDDAAEEITLNANNGVLIPQLGTSGYVGIGAGGLLTAVSAPSVTLGLGEVGYGDITTGAITSNNQFLYNTSTSAFYVAFGADAVLNMNAANQQFAYGDINTQHSGLASNLQETSATSWIYQIKDAFGGDWLNISGVTSGIAGSVRLGVPTTIGNGNAVSINDTANTFTLSSANNRICLVVPKTITAPATTGNQTIDKMSGSVNFPAGGAAALVINNALVTANTVVMATVASNDATMKSVQAVAGTGIITLYQNANPTANTRVNFLITN